jgi:HTH-type transcriptional regulator/antitoxin HipB
MELLIRVTDQLGPHLKSLRKARGLSQSDLGKLIGVGQTRVTEIEANPGLVNLEQLMKVFRALGAELILRSNGVALRPAKPGSPSEDAGSSLGDPDELDPKFEKSRGTALHRDGHKGTW